MMEIKNLYIMINDSIKSIGESASESFLSLFFVDASCLTQTPRKLDGKGMVISFKRRNSESWRSISMDRVNHKGMLYQIHSCGISENMTESINKCEKGLSDLLLSIINTGASK